MHGKGRPRPDQNLQKKELAPGGARTPDPGLIRPMLYQLSYQSSCRHPGSNQGPSDLQSDALPTELYRRECRDAVFQVHESGKFFLKKKNQKRGHGGIEPPTSPTLKENHTTRPMPHAATAHQIAFHVQNQNLKTKFQCLEWDSNPRLQERLELESSALDRSAIQACNGWESAHYENVPGTRTQYKMEHRGFDPRTSCLQSTHSSD